MLERDGGHSAWRVVYCVPHDFYHWHNIERVQDSYEQDLLPYLKYGVEVLNVVDRDYVMDNRVCQHFRLHSRGVTSKQCGVEDPDNETTLCLFADYGGWMRRLKCIHLTTGVEGSVQMARVVVKIGEALEWIRYQGVMYTERKTTKENEASTSLTTMPTPLKDQDCVIIGGMKMVKRLLPNRKRVVYHGESNPATYIPFSKKTRRLPKSLLKPLAKKK